MLIKRADLVLFLEEIQNVVYEYNYTLLVRVNVKNKWCLLPRPSKCSNICYVLACIDYCYRKGTKVKKRNLICP